MLSSEGVNQEYVITRTAEVFYTCGNDLSILQFLITHGRIHPTTYHNIYYYMYGHMSTKVVSTDQRNTCLYDIPQTKNPRIVTFLPNGLLQLKNKADTLLLMLLLRVEYSIREGREFVDAINNRKSFSDDSNHSGTEVVVLVNNVQSSDGSGDFFVRVRWKTATLTYIYRRLS